MKADAVVLLSGGQDSTVCLHWALQRWRVVRALTFDYGQRHRVEIEAARTVAHHAAVTLRVVPVPALAQLAAAARPRDGISPAFVPGRNAVFGALAAAHAQTLGARHVVVGACKADADLFPDCRRPFLDAMEHALGLGLSWPVRVHAPLIGLTKAETFRLAGDLGVLDLVLRETRTCYEGSPDPHPWGLGCGACPACRARAQGWREYRAARATP